MAFFVYSKLENNFGELLLRIDAETSIEIKV